MVQPRVAPRGCELLMHVVPTLVSVLMEQGFWIAGSRSSPTFDIGLEHQKMPKVYPGADRNERVSAAQVS